MVIIQERLVCSVIVGIFVAFSQLLQGRRKTWIIPVQTLSGLSLLLCGKRIETWVENVQVIVSGIGLRFVSNFML